MLVILNFRALFDIAIFISYHAGNLMGTYVAKMKDDREKMNRDDWCSRLKGILVYEQQIQKKIGKIGFSNVEWTVGIS